MLIDVRRIRGFNIKFMFDYSQLSIVLFYDVAFAKPFIVKFNKIENKRIYSKYINAVKEDICSLVKSIAEENKDFIPHQIFSIITERYYDEINNYLNSNMEDIANGKITLKQYIKN